MSTRRQFMQAVSGLIPSFLLPDVALAAMASKSGKVVEDRPLLRKQLEQLHARYSKPLENMSPLEIEEAARGCSLNLWSMCREGDEPCNRYDLYRPAFQKGFTYATDGRSLIRTSLPTVDAVNDEELRLPEMTNWLPWEYFPDAHWKKWPTDRDWETDSRPIDKCPYCEGRAVVGDNIKECDDCDQDGRVSTGYYYDYGDDHTCLNCYGTKWYGGTKCKHCDRFGHSRHCRILHDRAYTPAMCRRIEGTGAAEIEYFDINHLPRPVRYDGRFDESMPLLLRFNGGEAQGLAMPLSKD